MIIFSTNKYRPRRKGEFVELPSGRKRRIRKTIPKGCSTPRQICIKCLDVSIHKNDSNYSKKICKSCEQSSTVAPREAV